MASLHVSPTHWLAVYDMRDDAMRDSILSWTLRGRAEMESTDLRRPVRRNSLRSVRVRNAHDARAAFTNLFEHAEGKNIHARLNHRGARAQLDVSARALARFLECSACVPLAVENVVTSPRDESMSRRPDRRLALLSICG